MPTLVEIINHCTSWNDIYTEFTKHNVQNDRSAGKLFEEFCKCFYLCEPTVKNEYKNVWLFHEVPREVKAKLNLGAIDHGIDLVLEDYEKCFSVVQCKFRNDQSSKISWTKDSLANLFADGDKADYFIVFTNASGLDKHSLSKKENQLKMITIGDLVNISTSTIDEIKNLSSGLPTVPIKIKQPREYQQAAIQAVVNGFDQKNRGQLILPCGAGKTLVSLWIKESLKSKHTLVLVPSLALLRQIKNEWAINTERFIPYICVCSEKDINKDKDSTVVHAYEIGGKVSTNADEIALFLNSHDEVIVYSTYQSLEAICKAIKNSDFKFDLAICDEAHKTSGSKISKFGLIHSDLNIQVKKRLYMTATPRVMSDNLKNELNSGVIDYVCDMDNPDIYGSEFYRMSFKEAIEKGILVDYQIVAIGIDNQELEEAIRLRKFTSEDESIDEIANNYALEKFMQKHNATHAITFHSSVKKAKAFQERHQSIYPELPTYHVNGEQTTNSRNVLMNQFKTSSKSVITNARCLTEGVDVPAIDVVYFCDPKNSKIDIVQATGRALRRADYKGKKLGYVVVPIFHREKENVEEMIQTGAFKNLMSVVRALCSQDERLVDEIKKIKIGKGERQSATQHVSINYSCDLITIDGFHDELRDGLFDQMIDKVRVPWRSFEEARVFIRTLKLNGWSEWIEYSKSVKKPSDIPRFPNEAYEKNGWKSMDDWLGTGRISKHAMIFRPYIEAKSFVISLNLKSVAEWKKYCKSGEKPSDIPSNPRVVYEGKGWKSLSGWLGTGNIAPSDRIFLSFEKAREFIHRQRLKSVHDWNRYAKSGKMPGNIPRVPYSTYKNKGWVSFGDWLGTGNVAPSDRIFLSFEEARKFIHGLELKDTNDWKRYFKSGDMPSNIPTTPSRYYKNNGWKSLRDWLGTTKLDTFRSFLDAREFVRNLKFKSERDWIRYCKSGKKPIDIPWKPSAIYKNKGWISLGDWLGTGSIANRNKVFRAFEEAKKFAHSLKLKNYLDWKNYSKSGDRPSDIPGMPSITYKNEGWKSMADWLGTGKISNHDRVFLQYEKAKAFVSALRLNGKNDWVRYSKSGQKPDNIPANPYGAYRNKGWISWADWLGKKL